MITNKVYLYNGKFPKSHTVLECDYCGHTINAGPNYTPKFCDMCGSKIKEDLLKVNWKNEDILVIDYVDHILNNTKDYVIFKVKYEHTQLAMIGLPPSPEHIPVFIGSNLESIVKFANSVIDQGNYIESDFEPATESELIEYSKLCGKYWKA